MATVYKIVNGHKAEISGEFVALMARGSDEQLISAARPEILDSGRVTPSAVKSFALRTGAATVDAVRQFAFCYDTPWEMSTTRGTVVKTRRYTADGRLVRAFQETSGY